MYRRAPSGAGLGFGPPPPRDILMLLGVVFVTFSLQYFVSTQPLMEALELTPAVWRFGFVWQVVTYAFIGQPEGPIWFLVTLLILFWFGRDVYRALGRRSFWRTLLTGVVAASVTAVAVAFLMSLLGGLPRTVFLLIQGQHILTLVLIAAFATLYGNATILLFFVLPVQARMFLWLEILIAFLYFLLTKDLPGFVGTCAAVGMVYSSLRMGGPFKVFREWRLRIEKLILQERMRRMRAKKGFKIVKDDDDVHRGPWIN